MYLGGKRVVASRLVNAINSEVGATTTCWEPFVGAGHMTEHLAKTRRGIASDVHPALMSMWLALRSGWRPPGTISREQWIAAQALPDTDPLKAFAGFGCSFGGMYFGFYAAAVYKVDTRWKPSRQRSYDLVLRNYASEARRGLVRIVLATRHWQFEQGSFFERKPEQMNGFIYADPPYAGTESYSTGEFSHEQFWERCREWAVYLPVLVSEYTCPVKHSIVFAMRRNQSLSRSIKRSRTDPDAPVERLFRVLPPQPRIRTKLLAAADHARGC